MPKDIFDQRSEVLSQEPRADIFEQQAAKTDKKLQDQYKLGRQQGDKLLDQLILQSGKNLAPPAPKPEPGRGVAGSFQRGLQSGVSGIPFGGPPADVENETWYEHLAKLGGGVVSDLPAIMLGGEAGAIAGSSIPVIGTAVGGAMGAFMLPSLLNQSYQEYARYAKDGHDLTFGEFLSSAGRITKQTGKAGIMGAALGKAHKLLPYLREIPGMDKILNTRIGKATGEVAADIGALTGTQAVVEGEIPSGQDIADNAALVLGARVGGAAAKKLKLGDSIEALRKPVQKAIQPALDAIADKTAKLIPEGLQKKATALTEKIKALKSTAQEAKFFEMLEDHIGKRDARMIRSQFKWNRELAKLEKAGKLPKGALEDMMYYRQKTGNPFKEGDTYDALKKRLPEQAKSFVDNVVDKHFKETLKNWNESPDTRNINPREALEEIYLPGLYEYDPKKYARAYEEVSKQFKTRNPFTSEKKFLSYMEAFQEKGLVPRYKNIVDLMRAYDQIMIKTMGNNELLKEVKSYEKNNGIKLIVNPTNTAEYRKARANGYVPFDDVFLRRYVTGVKDGKPVYATSARPALVHPEFTQAFQGVFKKNAYTPENPFWKYYDSFNDIVRFNRVAMSPFHYVALMESALGSKGPKALQFKKWMQEGKNLFNNEEFMVDAAQSGLVTRPINESSYKKGQSLLDKGLAQLENKGWDAASKNIKRGMSFLFDEFHPYLKLTTWREIADNVIKDRVAAGTPPDAAEIKQIKKDVAKHVNNIYGGQKWETMKWLNNPKTMKIIRRMIGYPDWTTSAIRQAAEAFDPGLRGELSRKYWRQYGVSMAAITALMRTLSSGFTNIDPDASPAGIRWDINKALNGIMEDDPTRWYHWALPDIPMKIAGKIYNPGRDEKNRKLYVHVGKQALELGGYRTDFVKTLFSKASPLIQIVGKQIIGGSPQLSGMPYPAQATYKSGRLVPWKGTEFGSLENILSRARDVLESMLPFTVRNITEKGIAPFVASGAGAVPISKSMSLFSAEPLIKKAMKKKNTKELNRIKRVLKNNGYREGQIRGRFNKMRKEIKEES